MKPMDQLYGNLFDILKYSSDWELDMKLWYYLCQTI